MPRSFGFCGRQKKNDASFEEIFAVIQRRDSGLLFEKAGKFGGVAETAFGGDLLDLKLFFIPQQTNRVTQPALLEILVRRHADDRFEDPPVMDRSDAENCRFALEIMFTARCTIDFIGILKDLADIFVRTLRGGLFDIDPGDEFFRQHGQPVPVFLSVLKEEFVHLLQDLLERNGVADGCDPVGKIMFQRAFQFVGALSGEIEKETVPGNIAFRDPAVSLVAETEKNERTFQGDFAVFVRPSDLGPGHQADAQPDPFQIPAGMQSLPAGNETHRQLIEIVIFSD